MKRLAVILALLAAACAALPATVAAAAKRPIVYVIVIDGLDGDRVDAEAAPFMTSLINREGGRATYYPQSLSVLPAETNPNHTAMMSGSPPGQSGIPSNQFAIYAPLANEDSCRRTGPFNFRVLPNSTSGENANCPQAQFIFEAVKRQGAGGRIRTAAIFGKPKLGLIFGGENVRSGRHDADFLWAPCDDGASDDDYCEDVPTNPITGYAIDDATVMDQVIETIDEGIGPGRKRRPDFTFVNLPQVDSAGHVSGTGASYTAAIMMADAEIERLVEKLRQRKEWSRTALMIVSDHSMDTVPQKISLTDALTAGGIPDSAFTIVQAGSADYVYLADRKAQSRFALLKRMRKIALATPGVSDAFYREPNPRDANRLHTINKTYPGFGGPRTGDLLVFSKPGQAFSDDGSQIFVLPGMHGAPQTADNFMAVFGGGSLVRSETVRRAGRSGVASNMDVASTAMGLLGLFPTADNRGHFLSAAFSRKALLARSRPRRPSLRIRDPRRAGGKVLVIRPAGGRYDVQVRRNGRWVSLSRKTKKSTVGLPASANGKRIRARSRSAAGIPSHWRSRVVR